MEKITKHMTIGITPSNQAAISISPDITAAEALQLLGTLSLHVLNAYNEVAKSLLNSSKLSKHERAAAEQGIKESMYDAADNMFSSVLTQFYPDAPKNSIEEEAIITLQNKLIEERYNKLSKEEKSAYKKQYDKMKYVLKIDKLVKQGQTHGTTDSERS